MASLSEILTDRRTILLYKSEKSKRRCGQRNKQRCGHLFGQTINYFNDELLIRCGLFSHFRYSRTLVAVEVGVRGSAVVVDEAALLPRCPVLV